MIALQSALMRAVGEFGADPRFAPLRERVLATAAALDYVLMLVSGAAGTRILERDAERAIRDGIARAVDDLIAAATAIAKIGTPKARAFARETAKALHDAVHAEHLATEERRFALIALANP
ncbi:MAG TPA: hypothetical protein VGN14_09260 [Candidatus Elarobacter sp.]